MKLEGQVATDNESISNLFATFFSSVYTVNTDHMTANDNDAQMSFTLDDIRFTTEEVEQTIEKCDRNNASSPVGIPMIYFSETKLSIVEI